jgi:hypothetical protein
LKEMNSFEVTGRNLVLENILFGYVEETLKHDVQLLDEAHSDGFRVLGLERRFYGVIDGFNFVGVVDRMDSYKPNEVRIVDYKTGHVSDEDLLIDDTNAASVVDALFAPDSTKRPKIALQLFLYDHMVGDQAGNDDRHARPDRASALIPGSAARLVNSIYSTARLYSAPLPDVPVSAEFCRLAMDGLHALLTEIVDLSTPFRRTTEPKTCEWCDFKAICGR